MNGENAAVAVRSGEEDEGEGIAERPNEALCGSVTRRLTLLLRASNTSSSFSVLHILEILIPARVSETMYACSFSLSPSHSSTTTLSDVRPGDRIGRGEG